MLDIERLIHSFKTAVACLIGIVLTQFIGFEDDQWVVISILVIMCSQIYVGSVLQKGYLRFFATLLGSSIALITIVLTGPSYLSVLGVICVSSFIFSYIATSGKENLMYASSLGAITIALILLSKDPTIKYALARFIEISVGVLIATVISQFLLPIHAKTHLRRTQAKTLEQIKEFYQTCIVSFQPDMENLPNRDLEENIINLLFKQRKLAKEAKNEPFGASFDPEHCMRLLRREKEMLRAIDLMHTALLNIRHSETILLQSAAFQGLNKTVLETLSLLIKTIAANTKVKFVIEPLGLKNLREEFIRYIPDPSREELVYIDGFIFATDILIESLTKLASLYQMLIDEEEEKVQI